MGASLGAIGTARAQYHLRQILVALNLFTLNQPEVVIADAAHRFDENGNLIHEPTKQLIQELLKNLVDWTRRISPAPERPQRPAQLRDIRLAAARPHDPGSAHTSRSPDPKHRLGAPFSRLRVCGKRILRVRTVRDAR